jgi:hypothetical protein
MFRPQPVIDALNGAVIQQDRAKQILLGWQIMRHTAALLSAARAREGLDVALFLSHASTVAMKWKSTPC